VADVRGDRPVENNGRGRDPGCPGPPARIPASGTTALGSYLGYERRDARQARDVASCPSLLLDVHGPAHSARMLSGAASGARFAGPCSLGQVPSLHRLRRRLPGLVRRFRRYYGPVRLPRVVHHRRWPMAFPMRPAAPLAAGNPGISRFSRKKVPHVRRVYDRAGPGLALPWRHAPCCLPLRLTASAP